MKNTLLLLGLFLTLIGCQHEHDTTNYSQPTTELVNESQLVEQQIWLNDKVMNPSENTMKLMVNGSEERSKSVNKPHQSPF